MDIANYFYNWLLTKCDSLALISKKTSTNIRQNLEHVYIFENGVSTFISSEKYTKSDIWKTWKGIFIDYTKMTKYLKVWALYTYQVLITNIPIINKIKRGANLLMEHPLLSPKRFV